MNDSIFTLLDWKHLGYRWKRDAKALDGWRVTHIDDLPIPKSHAAAIRRLLAKEQWVIARYASRPAPRKVQPARKANPAVKSLVARVERMGREMGEDDLRKLPAKPARKAVKAVPAKPLRKPVLGLRYAFDATVDLTLDELADVLAERLRKSDLTTALYVINKLTA